MNPSEDLLFEIAARLKALADPTRLRILHTLDHGELSVQEILARVGSSQPNVSKHLAVLRRAGILTARRDRLHVLYRVADETAFAVCRAVCRGLERELTQLARLRSEARRTGSGVGRPSRSKRSSLRTPSRALPPVPKNSRSEP
jgi:DNA-binding transcriptional ArsR family regulator